MARGEQRSRNERTTLDRQQLPIVAQESRSRRLLSAC
jgi:hypothetical protein